MQRIVLQPALVITTANTLKQYSAGKVCAFRMWGCGLFSDVICVLLLSGLQKEDLDANTMEKLRRHNVNIYDMNNESLRQECLLKSLDAVKLPTDVDTTEGKNETPALTINIETRNGRLNFPNTPKPELTETIHYFSDKPHLKSLIEEMKSVIPKVQNSNNNIKPSNIMETNRAENNVTTINNNNKNNAVPGIEYIENQPSIDSVMNFWSRFTQKAQTPKSTTFVPPRIEEVSSTTLADNKGYIHSREMEYVNRMISEYLASQTEPTTTQATTTTKKPKNVDLITRKLNELFNKNKQDQELDSFALNQAVRAFGGMRDLGRLVNNKDNNNAPQQAPITQKVIYYNNEQLANFVPTPNNPINNNNNAKNKENTAQKIVALQYLDNILRLNKESKQAPVYYTENTTPNSIVYKNEQKTSDKRVPGFQYADAINYTNNVLRQGPPNMGIDKGTVSADVIQTIAEMVKEIVMKDIKREKPTNEDTTPISSTSNAITISPTESPAMIFKKSKEGNQVMQQIMDLFKEFNGIKDTTKPPVRVPVSNEKATYPMQSLDRMYPSIMAAPNSNRVNAPGSGNVWPAAYNTYKERMVPIALSAADKALQVPYRIPPITLQTNSGEIPPLAIQVSKPLINSIIVTQNPFGKLKGQPQPEYKQVAPQNGKTAIQPLGNTQTKPNNYITPPQLTEVLNVGKEKNRPIEDPTYADLTKKLRIAEDIKNEFRDAYRLQKLKEKINYAREQTREKARELTQSLGTSNVELNRLLEPSYSGFRHIVGSGHPDTLGRNINANYPDIVNRAIDSNPPDSLISPIYSNRHEPFSRPLETSDRQGLNPLNFNPYNTVQNINSADDLNQREIITREVLSRLVGSNHHDVVSRLVGPSRYDVINRPMDLNQQSRSHHSDAYERIEHERMHPRYKGARFHEELERIEHLPRNHLKATTTCCDVIARQQMPLAKMKHNSKYDDTHFRNFLKSQQKVTDMLEKILAAKTKSKPHSVETP